MPTHQFVSVSAIHPQYMQRQHKSGHTAIGLFDDDDDDDADDDDDDDT